jgi:hypothetical protein
MDTFLRLQSDEGAVDFPTFGCSGKDTSGSQAYNYFDYYLPRRLGIADFQASSLAWRAFLHCGNANGQVSHRHNVLSQASVVHHAVLHNPVLPRSHLWMDWRQPMFMLDVRPDNELTVFPDVGEYIFP